MSKMSYLSWLWENWKYYRFVKDKNIPLWEDKLPSQTFMKYPMDCAFSGQRVLNLGCGLSIYKAPNVVNLDVAANEGINVVHDLSKMPLPFPDDSFDFIIANHVLEHIPNWFECFKELCRVIKPNGVIEVWVPPTSSDTAFTYRDHLNRIGVESFSGTGEFRRAGTNLLASIEFSEKNASNFVDMIWHGKRTIFVWWLLFTPEWFVNWATKYLRNTVSEIGFKFKKRSAELCK